MLTFLGGAVASTIACAWIVSGCRQKREEGGRGWRLNGLEVFQRAQGRSRQRRGNRKIILLFSLAQPVRTRKSARKTSKVCTSYTHTSYILVAFDAFRQSTTRGLIILFSPRRSCVGQTKTAPMANQCIRVINEKL